MKRMIGAGLMLAMTIAAVAAPRQGGPKPYRVPTCKQVVRWANLFDADIALDDALKNYYPKALIAMKDGSEPDITPTNLKQIVVFGGCLASVSAGDDVVNAMVPLFASKRYGEEAFRILDQGARAGGAYSYLLDGIGDRIRQAIRSQRGK